MTVSLTPKQRSNLARTLPTNGNSRLLAIHAFTNNKTFCLKASRTPDSSKILFSLREGENIGSSLFKTLSRSTGTALLPVSNKKTPDYLHFDSPEMEMLFNNMLKSFILLESIFGSFFKDLK